MTACQEVKQQLKLRREKDGNAWSANVVACHLEMPCQTDSEMPAHVRDNRPQMTWCKFSLALTPWLETSTRPACLLHHLSSELQSKHRFASNAQVMTCRGMLSFRRLIMYLQEADIDVHDLIVQPDAGPQAGDHLARDLDVGALVMHKHLATSHMTWTTPRAPELPCNGCPKRGGTDLEGPT